MSEITNATTSTSATPSLAMPSAPKHLSPRLSTSSAPTHHGSLSPSSIPSSPTSIHSAESAIFERDIELAVPAPTSHASHQPNPHRIPRARNTEQNVPSVLDSAAAILTGDEEDRDVDVEFASRTISRSPSPRSSMLLSGGSPAISIVSPPARPFSTELEPQTPGSMYYSLQNSPTAVSRDLPPVPRSPQSMATATSLPTSNHSKRLSFIAYSDLLASAPVSTVPLTSLTTEPVEPPHMLESSPSPSQTLPDEWEREGLGMGLEERLAALGSRPSTRPPSFVSAF